jgi:type IV secretion system protein VirD4
MTKPNGFSDFLFNLRIAASALRSSRLFQPASHGLHKARFAYPHELTSLYVPDTTGQTRLPIAKGIGGRALFLRPQKYRPELGNVAIFAPTRGGKGLDAVCKILTWRHSLIVNDIKGELYQQTAGYRSRLGKVYVLDPTGVGNRYDPYQGRLDDLDIGKFAANLLHGNVDGENGIFLDRARRIQEALVKGARAEGYPVFPYLAALLASGMDQALLRLETIDPALTVRILTVGKDIASLTDKFLVHAWATMDTKLAPLLSDTVVSMLSGSDFQAADLLTSKEPITVYLRWPERYLVSLAPLVRLLWHSFIDELLRVFDERQGTGCNPVLLLIDEAARTAIPSLSEHATTVVGRKIILCLYFQSLTQLEMVYGLPGASIILDNTDTQVFYRPNRNFKTNKLMEDNLGLRSDFARSESMREGQESSEGKSEQAIPLIPSYLISQMRDTDIIGFHRNLPPFKAHRLDPRDFPLILQRRSLPPPEVAKLECAPRLFATRNLKPERVINDSLPTNTNGRW